MLINKPLKSSLPLFATLRGVPAYALLCLFSATALADRPAMEERTDAMNTRAESPEPAEMYEDDNRPASGPSAVELMMQQQSQTRQTGDVLQMQPEEIQPGQTLKVQLLDTPRRGASMERVRQELGDPVSIADSVGTPPITRWTYPDRIVYFEYSNVIHVVKR